MRLHTVQPVAMDLVLNLPPTAEYQKGNVQGYNYVMNWEPSKGHPNSTGFAQTAGQGLFYDTQFTATNPPAHAQLMSYVFTDFAGVSMGAAGLATNGNARVYGTWTVAITLAVTS